MENFTINTKNFKEALEKVQKINTPKINKHTVFNTVKITVLKNKITLIKTNNDQAIATDCKTITCNNALEYSFLISSPVLLLNFLKKQVKSNPELQVVFNEIDNFFIIKIKNNQFTFPCAVLEDYPIVDMSTLSNATKIIISQKKLLKAIDDVIYCSSADPIKPVFNGVYFHSDKTGELNLIGTDSHRMAISSITIDNNINRNTIVSISAIIPLNSIKILKSFLDKKDDFKTVKIISQADLTFFIFDNNTIVKTRNIDGQFPNYKQVIPSEFCNNLSNINKNEIMQALDDIILFTGEPNYKIVLSIQDNKIFFNADNKIGYAGQSIINLIPNDTQDNIKIGVNCQFLMDALKNTNSDNITIKLSGAMSPIIIENFPNKPKQNQAIIMPIKIEQED